MKKKPIRASDKAWLMKQLAVNGGPRTRTTKWPERMLLGRAEKAAVNALFDKVIAGRHQITYNGPDEEAYCKRFAEHMGGGYADAVNSGTSAVYVGLRALEPEPFTEIIVSPITDHGGVMPIPLLNCIPMIADTAPGCFAPGPKQIEELISPRTSAIVVTHVFGEPADMQGIMRVARKRKIPVLEDCAQAHCAKLKGRLVGTFGDVAAFSTMFGKHYCTGGQGGMVYTRSAELYNRIRRASDRGKPFGLPEGSGNCLASLNFNMDDLAAVLGSAQLRKLPKIVERRRKLAGRIREGLDGVNIVSFPPQLPGAEPSYWFLRLRFHPEHAGCDKDCFCAALAAEGILVRARYVNPVHYDDWFKKRRVFGSSGLPWTSPLYKGDPDKRFPCPNAIDALDRHFDLRIMETWGAREARDIVRAIRKTAAAYAATGRKRI